MPRQARPVGTWGTIAKTEVKGRWRARARYRDYSGATRLVERTGTSATDAENNLLSALRDMSPTPATGAAITSDTLMKDVAEQWLLELESSEEPYAPATITLYTDAVRNYVLPGIGDLRVREANAPALNRFFLDVRSPAMRKRCKVVVKSMMALSIVHGAVDSNPVTALADRSKRSRGHARPKVPVRTLSILELHQLRTNVASWCGANRYGSPRGADLPDLFDVLAGTGVRIGEALATQWADLDLGSDTPTLTVTGTVVRGQRQAFPKSSSSHRTVVLPAFTIAALRRQQARDIPTDCDLVFPSRTGGPRSTNNVRRQIREARGPEFDWVVPHTFRKTAATIIERSVDVDAAAAQLGHSGTAVTRLHYISRAAVAPDLRHALDALAPDVDGLLMDATRDGTPGDLGSAV